MSEPTDRVIRLHPLPKGTTQPDLNQSWISLRLTKEKADRLQEAIDQILKERMIFARYTVLYGVLFFLALMIIVVLVNAGRFNFHW